MPASRSLALLDILRPPLDRRDFTLVVVGLKLQARVQTTPRRLLTACVCPAPTAATAGQSSDQSVLGKRRW